MSSICNNSLNTCVGDYSDPLPRVLALNCQYVICGQILFNFLTCHVHTRTCHGNGGKGMNGIDRNIAYPLQLNTR